MAFVRFSDKGYDYYDEGNYVLFSTDKEHENLFEYVSKDLTELSETLEDYVSKKMNVNDFDMTDYKYTDSDRDKVKNDLQSIHEYYANEHRDVIINAIGNYFNALIIYSCYKNQSFNHIFNREWYVTRFKELTKPFLFGKDKHSEMFYNQYKEWVDKDNLESIGEQIVYNVPKEQPRGFEYEIRTQQAIKKMLFWLLDISAPSIGTLTGLQRAWLYGNIFKFEYNQSEMKVTKQLLFRAKPRYSSNTDVEAPPMRKKNKAYYDKDDNDNKTESFIDSLHALSGLNVSCGHVPEEMLDMLHNASKYAKTVSSAEICEEYEVNNLHQLLYLEIVSMLHSGVIIKKCKRCDKYFVVTNRKIAYCKREIEGTEKTCSTVGSNQSFQKKMNEEPELKIYNRAYKTHYARTKNGTMSNADFNIWSKEAKAKLQQVRNGKLDIVIFEAWLKK